jgi:hypothetical protein
MGLWLKADCQRLIAESLPKCFGCGYAALCRVLAKLRLREESNLYYGWAEKTRKIRARRTNWDANHN